MIITLTGANFASSNIGTLSTWRISPVLGEGATYDGVTSVTRDPMTGFSATVTIADGYELDPAGVTVTMGGATVGSCATINGNTITIAISYVVGNVVIRVPTVNTSTGEENSGAGTGSETMPTQYTIIYKYVDSSGNTINASTTESVAAGASRTFSTSNAPAISGYTISSVSPTSATINSNTTVTYTYTANESVSGGELLNLDFTTKTVADYISDGVLTAGDSTVSALTYDSNKGLVCNDTDMRYGLKLVEPIDITGKLTIECTATVTDYENSESGATDNNYQYWSIISGVSDDVDTEHTHGITCLAPCFNDFKLTGQVRFIKGSSTGVSSTNMFMHDGVEHTYKLVADVNNGTVSTYRDGTAIIENRSHEGMSGKLGYILGIHKGYNYATQYATEKGIYIKNLKVTRE